MTDSPSLPALETVNLTKSFGKQIAVDSLSLTIKRGTTFGFVGPNGAGKTTTIRMLMNMLRITSGRASIFGLDVEKDRDRIRDRVGYVPEFHFIYRWMRVREVIGFCRSLYNSWNDATCENLLALFSLDPNKKVKHLSKGMTAKLGLLLAISHEPDLLILDEPTSGLDPIVREEFLDGVLRAICDREQTVLFSSHTLSDVQRLADNVGIICEGKLLANCPTEELVTRTKRIRAILEDGHDPGEAPAGTIWQCTEGREWLVTVRDFSPEMAEQLRAQDSVQKVEVVDVGLEDVFKDFIKGRRVLS